MDEKEKQIAAVLLGMSEEEFAEEINKELENIESKNEKLQILQ